MLTNFEKLSRKSIREVTVTILFVGICVTGCTAPTISADLDRRFHIPPNLNTRPCSDEYRIVLNEMSAHYRVFQSPENEFEGGGTISFPLGETLDDYLRQAQQTPASKDIPLHFYISEFHFNLAGGRLSKPFHPSVVGEVRYEAHFLAPAPIGEITIQEESSAQQVRLWQVVAGAQETQHQNTARFYAVAHALRSTTTKLLLEVSKRMCPASTFP